MWTAATLAAAPAALPAARVLPAGQHVCRRTYITASRAIDDVRSGRGSCKDLMEHCLQRADVCSAWGLNCFTRHGAAASHDALLSAAKAADVRWANGTPIGPLDGVPVTVKDNFCVAGLPTGAASRMLTEPPFVAPYTATAVQRLQDAGAIVVARTNMDEFGMGSATAFSEYGAASSPYPGGGPDRVRPTAGGSSGGGAAATAMGAGLIALGSDTGGSVRQPAAFCGVTGFKGTYGRVSRWGLIAFASSLDCPGVMARSVRDAWQALAAIAGPDPRDGTCLSSADVAPLPATLAAGVPSLRGMTVGIPAEYLVDELPDDVHAWWVTGAQWLAGAGATVVPVSLPHTRDALAAYYVIAPAEAASNLSRYDGVRYGHRAAVPDGGAAALHASYTASRTKGFGPEVQRRIMVGTYVLSQSAKAQYYDAAVRVRQLVTSDFDTVFTSGGVDVLLTPTTPTPAWPVAATASVDAVDMYANDVMTVPASLAGLPAMSVPVGMAPSTGDAAQFGDMPVGLQVIGRRYGEAEVAAVGQVLEDAASFCDRVPRDIA